MEGWRRCLSQTRTSDRRAGRGCGGPCTHLKHGQTTATVGVDINIMHAT